MQDPYRFIRRHTYEPAQFKQAFMAVMTSPAIVKLGRDGKDDHCFTSLEMLEVERRLERSAEQLGDRSGHGVGAGEKNRALADASGVG